MEYLEANRFKLNPYDCCVANKMANGWQLKFFWHMGDLKIYHVDRNMVSYKNTRLEFIYGEIHGSQGKNHNYLGMYLDLSSEVESWKNISRK